MTLFPVSRPPTIFASLVRSRSAQRVSQCVSGGLAAALMFSWLLPSSASVDAQALPARGPFVMERGDGRQPIRFPRDETLEYSVRLDLGVLGSPSVGKVTMTSKVEPYFTDSAGAGPGVDPGVGPGGGAGGVAKLEQAVVTARAEGSYAVYSVEEVITTRVLPQLHPRLAHSTVQRGTENRRRELLIGRSEDGPSASYRADGHCKGCDDRSHFVKSTWPWQDPAHCTGCKRAEHRVWRAPRQSSPPDGALDMVSAVMLARTMVEQGRADAQFVLLDREKLWDLDLSRGRRGRRTTGAGEFDVVEVLLRTKAAGDTKNPEKFVGLFGMTGSISIWMHPESGVPIAITGTVPAGPVMLDVAVELERYSGAPESFRSVIKGSKSR